MFHEFTLDFVVMANNESKRRHHKAEDPRFAAPDYETMAAELDELAAVPTDVLAAWVTDRGRCLWETTFGPPPEWTGETEQDRDLATQMCAGCPVRVECLELELRVAGDQTVGVWGALNEDDRRALHMFWSRRRRADLLGDVSGEDGGDWS